MKETNCSLKLGEEGEFCESHFLTCTLEKKTFFSPLQMPID